MFASLSERLNNIFTELRRHGKLSSADVDSVMREVRLALLEADVHYSVVKAFVSRVRERAVGHEVSRALNPAQQVIKIVHEEIITTLGEPVQLDLSGQKPHVLLLVGLQGSGKTTAAAKLARLLRSQGERVLLVAADPYRPAAVKQLQTLGEQIGVEVFHNKGSQSLIRATEGTILQRLPPRIKIREGAQLELPHILVLIDDPEGTVIEPLVQQMDQYKKLYDFDLMQGSGHLKGYLVNDEIDIQSISSALEKLAEPQSFQQKYAIGSTEGVLLFAMGDGNHSLATAKAIWEKGKSQVGMDHPSRYALVEIENIHDAGLEFEPIHRVIFDITEDPLAAMAKYFRNDFRFEEVFSGEEMISKVENQNGDEHAIGIVLPSKFGVVYINHPKSNLPVGTIQAFLDEWLANGKAKEIDYVHGSEPVLQLGAAPRNLGIFLPAMEKSELFKTVILDGALPRKTFSMGEAHEKRFYMECRKIL